MRTLLWAAAVLVFLAGVQLFVFTERTERYFAWTIDPPLTAAFLGAAYWSSVAFEASAAREPTWVRARIAVPTVFVFTVLTLVVTLVHIENFHLGDEHEIGTQAVAWLWIAIYAIVPVLMAVLWIGQERRGGTDPPRERPLPPWLMALTGAQAVLLLVLGVGLLLAPESVDDLWPWALTPLTARAIGAWVTSLGVAAAHALVERDAVRLQPAAYAFIAFGVLQGVALARYLDTPEWDDPSFWVYVAFLVSAVVAGGATLRLARRS